MSDMLTPRTDKEDGAASEWHGSTRVVPTGFARQLERELADWHRISGERIAALERERDEARDSAAEWLQICKLREDERDTAIQHLGKQSRDAGLLEAEVERLKVLLTDWNDHAHGIGAKSQRMLVVETEAALGEG